MVRSSQRLWWEPIWRWSLWLFTFGETFVLKPKDFKFVAYLSSCPILFIPTSLKVVWHSQLILSFNLVCFDRVTMWEFTRKKRNFKGTTAKIFRVSLRLEQLLSNLTRPIWQNISLVKCKNSIEGLISQNERRLEKKQNCCNCTFGKFFKMKRVFNLKKTTLTKNWKDQKERNMLKKGKKLFREIEMIKTDFK